MNRISLWIGGVVGALAGVIVGGAAFWYVISPTNQDDQVFGPWSTASNVGRTDQNPYTRARVAIHGIWGLPPSEVVYFIAGADSSGAKLQRNCTYEVRGGPQPTRWWSLTLYRDGFYIDNPANRYSWSGTDAAVAPDGRWTITLAPSGEGRNRLSFGSKPGLMKLLFRLYQPNPGIAAHRDRVPLPEIRKSGCTAA